MMLYMVVEHFRNGDAGPVYQRFREKGRLAPEGLAYVSSWVDEQMRRCFQLMETDERALLDEWISHWADLVDFEIYPVMTSSEAAVRAIANRVPNDPAAHHEENSSESRGGGINKS
jgi:hypothetical protein